MSEVEKTVNKILLHAWMSLNGMVIKCSFLNLGKSVISLWFLAYFGFIVHFLRCNTHTHTHTTHTHLNLLVYKMNHSSRYKTKVNAIITI